MGSNKGMMESWLSGTAPLPSLNINNSQYVACCKILGIFNMRGRVRVFNIRERGLCAVEQPATWLG